MGTVYNDYYKKEDYFGEPYPGLKDFFNNRKAREHILDLGCGQGRDALYLASLGYTVTGVDHSEVGVEQMLKKAKERNLKLKGLVDDVYTFNVSKEYDVILLDSMLHFYKNDRVKESEFVKRILDELKLGGLLCVFMIQGQQREKILKSVIEDSGVDYEIILDDYTQYPEYKSTFNMLFVKKMS